MNLSIESIPMSIAIYEPIEGDFVFVDFNKRAEQTENISKKELIGKKVTEVFPGVKAMGFFDVLLKVSQTGEEELSHIGLYEDSRIAGWRKNRVSMLDGGLIMAIYEDIDNADRHIEQFEEQLHRKTQEVEKQNRAFETLFEKSSDGILIIENGKFTQCNEKIVEMLEYKSKDALLNINPSQLSPKDQPDGRESFEKAQEMMRLAVAKGGHSFEWLHTKATNEDFWAEIVLTPISLYDREIIHVVWRDISQRKAMEEKLQNHTIELEMLNRNLDIRVQAEVLKNKRKEEQMFAQSRLAQMGEMISMIAHQWRQPLSAISSTAANIETKIELEIFDVSTQEGRAFQNEYFLQKLDSIGGYVDNLTRTIEDFRNFYKPNKSSVKSTLREINQKALGIIRASLETDKIEVLFDCKSDKTIEMYDGEMMQVVLNIFKNSQDNFKEKNIKKPQILIETDESILKISDNGGGISEEVLEKIFDPYFSTKSEKNGTGLGLYMSKIIVEEHHNGKLLVENTEDGVCFSVDLSVVE
ncbi:MAG: ATP-binding protein [Campylobacterota bacterium]|nr:ATP-binding protein [Campylobacterota bacterium]